MANIAKTHEGSCFSFKICVLNYVCRMCCVLHCLFSVSLKKEVVEEQTELGRLEVVNRIWRLIVS